MAITKTKIIQLTVTIQEGDFVINASDALSVKQGETVGFSISIAPALGFNKAVKFSVTGAPVGTVVTWAPSDTLPAGGTQVQCILAVPLTAPLGTNPITLTGVSQ